jgi:hypothetical protein
MLVSTDVKLFDGTIEPEAHTEAKIDNGIWTTTAKSPDHSISQLISGAERYKNDWHIEGLWEPNTLFLVHSLEGEFKSIFAYQVGEALATGQPLLRKWAVPTPRRVGVLQTEMPDNMVGKRLKAMYPDGRIPSNLIVSSEALKIAIQRKYSAPDKFQVIHNWLVGKDLEVLLWDTVTSVLSACGNPNTEEATAQFYSRLEALPLKGALVVRHDGKPSRDSEGRQGNQKVRGSNLHAEIASVIIQMHRPDRRSNKAQLDIGKLRHDTVPEPLDCWFDAGTMRLTLLPPPVVLLEGGPLTREVLNRELLERFKLKERSADELIRQLEDEGFLLGETRGHERVWSLNPKAVPKPESPAAIWLPLVDIEPPEKIAEEPTHPHEICDLKTAA